MPPLYNRRPDSGLPASPGRPLVALPLGELLTRVRQTLSERFAESYWVVAEIADLTLPRYDGAHCYLVLTDQHTTGRGAELKAQARATIWSQRYQQLAPVFAEQTGQELQIGLKVMLRVQVKFHEQYGLSLDVVALDPSYTVGDLARQRRETIRKLAEQDLLERQQRLPLPLAPQRLAVISSPTAAGLQDFMQQLREAPYAFEVTLFAASMQGQEAPASIRAALDAVRPQRQQFDVVVIIRGGGSKTDLLAFDDFGLAAAVGSFPLPVLTGIGHERDEAVLDLTAHLSLKTPTATAVFLIERLARLDAVLSGYAGRIRELAQDHVREQQRQLRRHALTIRDAAQQQLRQHHTALQQRTRQAATVARTELRQQHRTLARVRQRLPRATARALAHQQLRLRLLGYRLARRFRRLHRRRCEQLVHHRYHVQLAAERLLHRAELRLARATVYRVAAAGVEETATVTPSHTVELLRPSGAPLLPEELSAGAAVLLRLPSAEWYARLTAPRPTQQPEK
ncbi:exodeoxyribonuclease VII large subunit [Hymenobacter aerilatus]|uniref:Exodeoxyribonuclease 7 large subunit n=1 Tax=Hymenobacter aerilatus TaxID=2932251 RepID=A0A8T9SWL7_9BACT|nr:exodeoxyribonuclease VII large subunit [Hymenobacter aerilatus]UOR05801.1 exodeoxyribonuclease VII large subunit [Hymenobacter aerilatus]